MLNLHKNNTLYTISEIIKALKNVFLQVNLYYTSYYITPFSNYNIIF